MNRDEKFLRIITRYRKELQKKIQERKVEMEQDNNDHYLIYNVLGFTSKEGYEIDLKKLFEDMKE